MEIDYFSIDTLVDCEEFYTEFLNLEILSVMPLHKISIKQLRLKIQLYFLKNWILLDYVMGLDSMSCLS